MDLKLFSAYFPPIDAEVFAAWPEHMRREFALLTAEHGYSDKTVHEATGISSGALLRARSSKALFAQSYSDFSILDEEAERLREGKRRWHQRRRQADA